MAKKDTKSRARGKCDECNKKGVTVFSSLDKEGDTGRYCNPCWSKYDDTPAPSEASPDSPPKAATAAQEMKEELPVVPPNMEDIEEEISLLATMYSDNVEVLPKPSSKIIAAAMKWSMTLGFVAEVTIPTKGYPETSRPEFRVLTGPNVGYVSQLERGMKDPEALEGIPFELPMLVGMMVLAEDKIREIAEEMEREASAKIVEINDEDLAAEEYSCGIDIKQGAPISDRKSKFLAHIATVQSVQDAMLVVAELRRNKSIAMAAHPTIWAYRFEDQNGRLHQDADDDGETGASKRLLFLLDQCKVKNQVVVVTRWFGGILLGPDRFKHIFSCAKEALVTHGVLPK